MTTMPANTRRDACSPRRIRLIDVFVEGFNARLCTDDSREFVTVPETLMECNGWLLRLLPERRSIILPLHVSPWPLEHAGLRGGTD